MALTDPFDVGYRGVIEPKTIAVKHSGLTKGDVGKPAKISANMEIILCADGETPAGQIVSVEDKIAALKVAGVFEYDYSGADPVLNFQNVQADGAGKVKAVVSGGNRVLVISVDSANKKVAFIL